MANEIIQVNVGIQGPSGQGVPVGGTTGQFLKKIDGTDFNTEWATSSATVADIADITNVVITAVSDGEVLTYDNASSKWINSASAGGGGTWGSITGTLSNQTDLQSALDLKAASSHTHVEADITDLQAYIVDITNETLTSLSDVTITAIAANEIVHWNGSLFVNATLAEAGITAVGHTHTESEITNLQSYALASHNHTGTYEPADATIVKDADIGVSVAAESHTHTESEITDLGTYLTGITGQSIQSLSDVLTIQTPTDGQVLTYDTTNGWQAETSAADQDTTDHTALSNIGTNTHAQIDTHIADATLHFTEGSISITESQVSDLGTYLTGITGEPLEDLSDIPTITGNAGKLLKVNPTATGYIWGDPSGTTVSWGDIAGTLSAQTDLQSALDGKAASSHTHTESEITDLQSYLLNITGETFTSLSDVTITTPSTGQFLTYNVGGYWENVTHSDTDTTDHTALSNIGTNTHAQIDTHIADATLHFTEGSISITESQISDLGTYLSNVSEDTTPQLGGNLDINGFNITSAGAGDTNITCGGSGDIVLSNPGAGGITIGGNDYPEITGTNGYVLTTNGAGTLSWTAQTTDTDTTDHTALSNIGTNTHTQIDTHIADATLHFTQGAISITESQVSDLGTYIPSTEKAAVNGVATLDAGGKVPSAQLPALALTDINTVVDETAQLALTAQEGDIAIRSDLNKTYAHNGGVAGTMADWSELLTPTDAVLSVDSLTGAVDLSSTYSALAHNHSGVYEPADATILKDADIGSTVQAYDATIVVDADIGSTVQAYSATNVLDADVTYELLNTNGDVGTTAGTLAIGNHNHTGVYEPADGTIVKDADIGVNVQAYDATIVVDADIGVSVAAQAHVHEGTTIDATAITDGYVLTADGAGNSAWEASAGGASAMNDLTDVVTLGVTDGGLLKWNNSGGVWEDVTNKLSSVMSDVTLAPTPADDEVLAYNSGTSQWINQTAAEAGLATSGHTHDMTGFQAIVVDSLQTTNATQSNLDAIAIPSGEERILVSKVRGHESATNDTAWRHMTFCVKNIAGTVSMVGGVASASGNDTGASAWDITATVSGGFAVIKVTGEAAHTIDWDITTEVS